MTNCGDIRARVGPYLDGELDAGDRTRVREHLDSCAGCAARVESERALLERVAEAGREVAPPSLLARVETIVRSTEIGDAGSASMSRGRWRAVVPLAVAAGVAALLLVTTPWSGGPGPEAVAIAEGFAVDHAAHAIEWPSLHPVGFEAPDPPDLERAELVGSSRCEIGDEPYAHYTYAVDGEPVSIYLPFDGDAPPRAGRTVEVGDLRVTGIDPVPGGSGAVIVSDRTGPGAQRSLHLSS